MSFPLKPSSRILINYDESRSEPTKNSDLGTDKKLSNESQAYASKQSPKNMNSQQFLLHHQKDDDVWQTDSNDSCVSFQANILDQHIYTLDFLLQKLQNSDFKPYAISLDDPIQSHPDLQQLEIEDYLVHKASSKGQVFCSTFLQIMSRERKLRRFLGWIYRSCHQIYLSDLILIFQKTVVYHLQLKQLALSWNELVQLASSSQFLLSIFSDDSLAVLNYGKIEEETQNSHGECISPAYFMRFYALTVLLVLENYFNHPLYSEAKQIKRKELEGRYNKRKKLKSALSKKIRKVHSPK